MKIDISRAQAIDGWMSDGELRWLAQAALSSRTIVEVGCYKGRSTRALADHCRGQVIAVDPWGGGYIQDDGKQAKWLDQKKAREAFDRNLADHVASGKVVPIAKRFADAIDVIEQSLGARADLLFVDGDHRYEAVIEDVANARRILRPGAILAGHDYTHPSWPGVKRAVDELFPNGVGVGHCASIWWVKP